MGLGGIRGRCGRCGKHFGGALFGLVIGANCLFGCRLPAAQPQGWWRSAAAIVPGPLSVVAARGARLQSKGRRRVGAPMISRGCCHHELLREFLHYSL